MPCVARGRSCSRASGKSEKTQIDERGAISNFSHEGRLIGEPDCLAFQDVRKRLPVFAQFVFSHTQESQRRSLAGFKRHAFAERISRLAEAAQLKERSSPVEPAFGPIGTKRERLFVESRRLLGMGVERIVCAAGQVVEIRGLPGERVDGKDAPECGLCPQSWHVPQASHRTDCTAAPACGSAAMRRALVSLYAQKIRVWNAVNRRFDTGRIHLGRVLAAAVTVVFLAGAQTPDPRQLFQEAMSAQQRGDYAVAIQQYRRVVNLKPDLLPAWVNLGVASGACRTVFGSHRQLSFGAGPRSAQPPGSVLPGPGLFQER